MEANRRKNPGSGETFHDSDFEFGSLTPTSPSQDPYANNSPADHLFLNGRLLPHAFPASTIRRISRTASEDSSRSNSTNSRSSSSSPNTCTPRTSSCSSMSSLSIASTEKLSERKMLGRGKVVNSNNRETYSLQCKRRKAVEIVTVQLYGSHSQRWQHITPVPGAGFKREGSVKRGVSGGRGVRVGGGRRVAVRGKKKAEEKRGNRMVRWWRSFIRAVVLACRECHAMEPERREDDGEVQRKSNCS